MNTEDLSYDKSREGELMDILNVRSMDEVTIIKWRPVQTLPEEGRYVYVKYYDESLGELTFDLCAYEHGVFSCPTGGGGWKSLRKEHVRGWAYPIYYPVDSQV